MTTARVARRQNAKRAKKRGHAVPLLLFLLILATCCALLWAAAGQVGLAKREFAVPKGLDPRAERLRESPFAPFRTENGPDTLSYRLNRTVEIKGAGGLAPLCVGSPIQNSVLMRVEILLDGGGEALFSSGLLLPGSRIETASLQAPLEAGEHPATAWFYAVDPKDLSELGRVSEGMTITVLS